MCIEKLYLIAICLMTCFDGAVFAAGAGTLDTAFNSAGVEPGTNSTHIDNILNSSEGYAIAIQTDGKIVLAGQVSEGGLVKFAVARFTTAGILDVTFNSLGTLPGTVSTDINALGSICRAFGVAIQTDGKIVVSGFVDEGVDRFAVARFNSDGTLDVTFNAGGTLPGTNSTSIDSPTNDSAGFGVALQADGKIVIAGSVIDAGIIRLALARFNSDGTLDTTTFNSGGTLPGTVSTAVDNAANPTVGGTVAIQSDGKIVAPAGVTEGGISKFGITRFNTDGSLDAATFNSGGTLPGTFSTFINAVGNESVDFDFIFAIQSDGKIISTGYVVESGARNLAVVRYNTDGSLDTTFNSSGTLPGTLSIAIGDDAVGTGVAVQTDGRIVVSGISTTAGVTLFTVLRLTSTGALDSTFNTAGPQVGVATTTIDNESIPVGSGTIANIAIQSNGKIVINGYIGDPLSRFAVARFLAEGTIENVCAT